MISLSFNRVYFGSSSDYRGLDFTYIQQQQIIKIFEKEIQEELKRIENLNIKNKYKKI